MSGPRSVLLSCPMISWPHISRGAVETPQQALGASWLFVGAQLWPGSVGPVSQDGDLG